MTLEEEIRSKFPNYKELANSAYNRSHDLWERRMYQRNAVFSNLKKKYGKGEKVTTRKQIIELFKDGKYYDAFLCAMIWGNIGTYKNGRAHFEAAFSTNQKDIEDKLKKVMEYLTAGKIEDAFISMTKGKSNAIPGVGVSFFTKILYFMGEASGLTIKPLIFDSTSVKILNRIYHDMNLPTKAHQSKKHYLSFVCEMNQLSRNLYLDSASYLEAFLFNYWKNLSST